MQTLTVILNESGKEMKDGKECEIKMVIPVLLQLQLNSPRELSRDFKAETLKHCYWELAQKLLTHHTHYKSTFLPSHVGRWNIMWRGPGWKTFCVNPSHQHKIKYRIKT